MKIRKPFFAFLLLILLLGLMAATIGIVNLFDIGEQKAFRSSLITQNAVRSLKILETEIDRVYETMKENTEAEVMLMVSALQNFTDGKRFTGQEIFEDGVVVRIKGDEILYPSDFAYRFEPMDTELLKKEPTLEILFMSNKDGSEQEDTAFTAKKISDDFWYIDWTSYEEYDEMLKEQMEIFEIIEDLQKSFDGYLFLFESKTPDLKTLYAPKEFEDVVSAADIGLSGEYLELKPNDFSIGDKKYFADFVNLRMFGKPVTAVFLINTENEIDQMVNNAKIILAVIFIVMVIVIMWLYWIQTYVRDHALTEIQKNDYHPAHIKKTVRAIGLIGVFLFFFIAASVMTLGNLSLESSNNNRIIDLLNDRMNTSTSINSIYRDDVETWAVYYAKKTAMLLAAYPEFQNREFLSNACDLFGSEYIILFDENGREVISSNSFVNLDLETDLVSSGNDFKKLLQGVSQIIHEPEKDLIEERTIQLIGVPVFLPDHEACRALIIAIDPEKHWQISEEEDFNSFLQMVTPAGNASFIAEKENNRITYSSENNLRGRDGREVGLYDNNMPDTELDIFRISTDQLYGTFYGAYQQDENYQYYYMTFSDIIQNNSIPFSLVTSISFLLIYWIITAFMLHPYNAQIYMETVRISKSGFRNSILDESVNSEWIQMQKGEDDQDNIFEIWKNLIPEKKTSIFIQITLTLVLILSAVILFSPQSTDTRSVIDFILRGRWRRGVNLLAFAGILILIISFIVFTLFKDLLMNLIGNALDRKVKTVTRLILSLIQYAAIIALLFYSFDLLGFDTRALLASVSLISLAVTLGAKDLAADILAGIFIIFEDDFRVGDIIEVNGFSGIVQEIGVRSTKLIGIGDNIKIIGNQSVKNVLNLSRMNSWYSIDLKVPSSQPIKEIEAMLHQELPMIGESIPEILSGPYYKGIMAIGSTNTLYIIAECKQEDYRKVQRELNHAILILFNEHGYKIE